MTQRCQDRVGCGGGVPSRAADNMGNRDGAEHITHNELETTGRGPRKSLKQRLKQSQQ